MPKRYARPDKHARLDRKLKLSDQQVIALREHFGEMRDPPVCWLAALHKVSAAYISDILRYYRRQDTSLHRRIDRRKGLARHPYPAGRKNKKD